MPYQLGLGPSKIHPSRFTTLTYVSLPSYNQLRRPEARIEPCGLRSEAQAMWFTQLGANPTRIAPSLLLFP